MGLEEDLRLINDFVEEYRARYKVVPSYGEKLELSCLAFGEGHNLLYRQLIPTINGDGYWTSMHDFEIRQLVLDEISKAKKEDAKGK